jgi:two-component system LytT family response regulator
VIRALIVDDEAFGRQRIRRLLAAEDDVEIVGECTGGREAIVAIDQHHPDLVFLDIQMPQVDGFGVLRGIGAAHTPLVIFVTAFDEHALRAFDVHALDYLLKPVDPDRFHSAVQRARLELGKSTAAERHRQLLALLGDVVAGTGGLAGLNALGSADTPARGSAAVEPPASSGARTPPPGAIERFLVKHDGRMFFVRVPDVDWIESYGNYARLHVAGRTHLIRETMGSLEKRLERAGFIRIHRSSIVNLDRVKEMQPWFSGEYIVMLTDGTKLKLSRWYRDRLEKVIQR